ncbi:MAG: hypothetical protein EHM93_11735 [Bacteroidales bacterium]|nr:MAG: hypothetical protein EHM93_11735 [Bacteroidales bacterium]
MNTLIILLSLTKGEATIEILSLLLVSAIIGYVTAWLYYKSIYVKRIKTLENEIDKMQIQLIEYKEDKRNFDKTLRDKDAEKEHLILEVKALKALHAEAVHETDSISLKNKRNEQLLYEKDEALLNIAQRKHLLNYTSFGTATFEEKDDLRMISGIGPFIEERLHALDIYTFRQISKFTKQDIETINNAIEYFSGRIERDEWIAQAKDLYQKKDRWNEVLKLIREKKSRIYYDRIGIAKKEEADDLTVISGIGGWIKEKLHALDIYTFRQISHFNQEDVDAVTEAIEYFPGRIERDEWILQAHELVRIAGKKTEILLHLKERKEKIYFDRLGVAHKHQANNLTLINGISLWVEERLNMLDIYTFEQISKLTTSDIETITEILGVSLGRIEREEWVIQAKELAKS